MPNANGIQGRAQGRRKCINASGKRVWRHYTWTVLRGPGPQLGAVLGGGLKREEQVVRWWHVFKRSPIFRSLLCFKRAVMSPFKPCPATLMTSPSPCSKQPWSESSKPWVKTNIFLYSLLSGIWSWKLIETYRRTSIFFFPQRQRYPYICYPKRCQTL